MIEELKGVGLADFFIMSLGSFIIGAIAGVFMGLSADNSDNAYKSSQQSCAVCEVVKNAQ